MSNKTSKMASLKMDDSDLALERAVQLLDVSSDSENDEREAASEIHTDAEPLNVHTVMLEQITRERLYTNSENMSQVSVNSEPRSTVSSMACGEVMVSLNNIIKDDRTFLMFRRFLKDQCITRNLNFWLACEHFRQLDRDNQQGLTEIAKAIYFKFVKTSAPQCVLILDRTRKQIKMVLELRMPLSPDLFSNAQMEIWEIMEKNELRQFLVSDSFADCHVFTHLETQSLSNAVYTPGMAHPAYGVCGGGSLQNSGSEDSASMISTDSDAGPRSAMYQLSRPYSSSRNAHSDTEGTWQRRARVNGPHFSKDKVISHEEFVALVKDRLVAVQKDREGMQRRAQDICRKQGGRSYEDIMTMEWYNLKDFESETSRLDSSNSSEHSHNRVPAASHTLSPSMESPASTPRTEQSSKPPHAHINSLALREVQDALKDLEITNQVSRKRRSHAQTSSKCSSVLSTASDSGVGAEGYLTSGLVTPNDRTHAYLHNQNIITRTLPERDMQAQAAAIALISNSPHQESLNPRIPPVIQDRERPRRSHHHQYGGRGNFPGAYSSDDSSSVFTMTSQSSTSDLFIPRRPHPAYSDSDEPHHYGSAKYHHHRKQLTTPRRSHKNTPPAPSPMATEQRLQHQQSSSQQQTPPTRSHSRHSGGDTLVVYHLDDFPTPFAKRVTGSSVTLADFKEQVFARKGDYRYFFKSFCEDIAMEILEEYSEHSAILPLVDGKIIGRVEKLA